MTEHPQTSPRPQPPRIYTAPPALIIGTANVEKLHAAGYRIMPAVASRAMRKAAAGVLSHHQEGQPWIGSEDKAALRYEAMLSAWTHDYNAKDRGREPEPIWRWAWGRFLEVAVFWEREPGVPRGQAS